MAICLSSTACSLVESVSSSVFFCSLLVEEEGKEFVFLSLFTRMGSTLLDEAISGTL